MAEPEILSTPSGRQLAFRRLHGAQPGVVFLGGFRSDMTGTKALHLEAWARRTGRAFVRFDYSGHGASAGRFEDGSIGDWAQDARAVLDAFARGPQVLVGSSMGGWIALLLARGFPEKVAALVTIAAAPDFTEDGLLPGLSPAERATLAQEGVVHLASEYGPYPVTERLIADGRDHLVLRAPLPLLMPVRCLQGTEDEAVPMETALRLLAHADAPDMRLTLVRGADHRFSDAACLDALEASLTDVLAACGGPT